MSRRAGPPGPASPAERVVAGNAAREHAACILVAAALTATNTIADAREVLDIIDHAETRAAAAEALRTFDHADMLEDDCDTCGERIIRLPTGPAPWQGTRAWLHLGTGQAGCASVPGGTATPRADHQP